MNADELLFGAVDVDDVGLRLGDNLLHLFEQIAVLVRQVDQHPGDEFESPVCGTEGSCPNAPLVFGGSVGVYIRHRQIKFCREGMGECREPSFACAGLLRVDILV